MKGLRRFSLAALALGLALCPGLLTAQEVGVPPPDAVVPEASAFPETYGPGMTIHQIQSYAFTPYDSATAYIGDGADGRRVTAGNTCFEAPVHLPNGASVLGIDLDACDNVVNNLTSTFYVCTNGSCTAPFMLNTSALSGCGHVSQTSGSPVTVDNNLRSYFLQICTGDTTATNKFRAGRILYALQVSPAPGTATFSDVPTTQPFFRFIEAFARAGITGGCGPGLFCPGANVTRQEMATFMAVALGLHFPN